MRRTRLIAGIMMGAALTCRGGDIIAQWDFNSLLSDHNSSTGTVLPSTGSGAVLVIGGTTGVFALGSENDPVEADNSAWNTSGYPAQATSNKTAGVQFNVSTAGYFNIRISWQQKVSNSASKYCRLQYSGDGFTFCDDPEPVVSISAATAFEAISGNLVSIPESVDNPNFAFRIVTEFESTAMGSGTEGYVTTFSTNSYSRSGTIRFDQVTITGMLIQGGNTAPFLVNIPPVTTVVGEEVPPISVTIRDNESPAEDLCLSATSSNPVLMPNRDTTIVFAVFGSQRVLNVHPAPGVSGVAPIAVNVSDGTNRTSSVFPLVVLPSPLVIFCDPFDYSTGSLLINSAYLWEHRAGAFAECEVLKGELQISSNQTEDVTAPLRGKPFAPGSNVVLYAGFKARFVTLPKTTAGYFAHFANGNMLRARIFATTANALPGCFKLLISNGSDSATLLPWNLRTNTSYKIVTRYAIDSATTTLWVNPNAESDIGATAADMQEPTSITSYGFRQDAQVGAKILVDDLIVGFSFAAVTNTLSAQVSPLTIHANGESLVVHWSSPELHLQFSSGISGPFFDVQGASSPYTCPALGPSGFFRLVSQ